MGQIFQALVVVSIFIFMIVNVSAVTDTFPQGQEAIFKRPVRVGDGLPTTSLTCNFTSSFPNGTTLINFQPMYESGSRYAYNLSANDTRTKGLYDWDMTCTDGVFNDTKSGQYLVNQGGVEPSQQRTDATGRIILIFFGLAIFCFISLFWAKNMPFKATIFLLMVWFILMGINASFISIQDEVINPSIENFFSFFLTISFWANYAIFIAIAFVWAVTFFINIAEVKKKARLKDYGV